MATGCEAGATCERGKGPGEAGCYWHPGIWRGACGSFWSITEERNKGYAWAHDFRDGSERGYYKDGETVGPLVRCVHDGGSGAHP